MRAEQAGASKVLMNIVPGLVDSVMSTISYEEAVLKNSHPVNKIAPPAIARGISFGSWGRLRLLSYTLMRFLICSSDS